MDTTDRRWCFECPDCQFDHEEAGRLATDSEVYCPICLDDCRHYVLLRRWRPDVAGQVVAPGVAIVGETLDDVLNLDTWAETKITPAK